MSLLSAGLQEKVIGLVFLAMNTKNIRLNIVMTDLIVSLTTGMRAVSSNVFSGWQYWFYFFSKTVKRALDSR
jgi:hypothetical protein